MRSQPTLKPTAFDTSFTRWAAHLLLASVAEARGVLDEQNLIEELVSFKKAYILILEKQQEQEVKLMQRALVIRERWNAHQGTLYGEILEAALRVVLEKQEEAEEAIQMADRSYQLLCIFIEAIRSALLPEEGLLIGDKKKI